MSFENRCIMQIKLQKLLQMIIYDAWSLKDEADMYNEKISSSKSNMYNQTLNLSFNN